MWKEISGWPDYRVCSCGNVITLKSGRPKILKQFVRDRSGHTAVNLLTHGTRSMKMKAVSRLVAAAFLPPPTDGQELVLHRDDNPLNNAADNLEWGTPAKNSAQMVERKRQARGERCGNTKLTSEQVLAIRAAIESGARKRYVARGFGVGESTVGDIVKRKIWRHI